MLLKESPDSPLFLGKTKIKIKAPKRRLFRKKEYADITSLRIDLNKLSESGKTEIHNRQKVRADLKNYPDVADLNIISAIYTFQDIPRKGEKSDLTAMAENKLNENQLFQLKKAIFEIVKAFHNGGLNIFNINWFMKIYLEYLNSYKGRLTYEYRSIAHKKDKQVSQLAQKLRNKQSDIISLMSIQDQLGGIARLSRRLNGTTYLSECFSAIEIKKATTAVQNGDPAKVITQDRTAAKIIFVLFTLLFLMAKVPILKDLTEEVLKTIPDDEKGILLRKRMVLTLVLMSEFEVALASGDKPRAREATDKVYAYCLNTINDYTKDIPLKEQYEIDPYLKAIWLVKSADGLFSRDKYKEMLGQAYRFLKIITGERNLLREPHREAVIALSNRSLYQLDNIMDHHGWIGEAESSSWQNRK